MKSSAYIVFAASLLAGCVQSSGALKMGPDTYSISVHAAPAAGGEPGARRKALTQAAEHCASLGQEILVTNTSVGPSSHFPGGTADITFKCLSKGDPELTRPDYRQSPDVVIESR